MQTWSPPQHPTAVEGSLGSLWEKVLGLGLGIRSDSGDSAVLCAEAGSLSPFWYALCLTCSACWQVQPSLWIPLPPHHPPGSGLRKKLAVGGGHWREACVGSVEDMGAHTHFLFLTPGRSHSDCACWSESLPRPGRCRCGLGKLFQEGYVTCLLANKWQSWDLNPGPEFPACSSLSSVPPSPSLDI